MKICARCRATKDEAQVYRNKGWRDGLHPYCRSCLLAYQQAAYYRRTATTPPKYRWARHLAVHDYFSKIDRPEKAYALGFIAADGNVLGGLDRVSIEISVRDRSVLDFLRDELVPTFPIRSRVRAQGENVILAFTSHQIAADLARYGITPNKSLVLPWPDFLAVEWLRPFLLGYFDGDGLTTISRWRHYAYPRWGLLGTEVFLRGARDFIASQTGAMLRKPWPQRPGGIWTTYVTGRGALLIDEWLHDGFDFGLQRKRFAGRLPSAC